MNAPAATPPAVQESPLEKFQSSLAMYLPEISRVLPASITPDRFAQICMNAVLASPDLLEAVTGHASARKTFFAEALKCATDGLVPDGREATFTSFKLKDVGPVVKYMPMIQGILKKVRNSGELIDIRAEVVYEKDEFDYTLGDREEIVHRRPKLTEERGKPIGCYAIARTKNDGVYREVMTEAQIQQVASVSRARSGGPWSGPFADEMRRKTVLRRLSKRLPMSSDIAGVMTRDDDLYEFGTLATPANEAASPQEQLAAAQRGQASKTREALGLAPGAPAAGAAKGATIEGEAKREPEKDSDKPADPASPQAGAAAPLAEGGGDII